MIRSVTEGVYSDFILINRHGVVIYTMVNDDIFGKSAVTGLNGSPLARCFSTKDDDVHVEDVSMFPPLSGRYSLFIALKASQDESFTGVFVLQVDSEKILSLLNSETYIISTDGKYRVTPRREEAMALYPQFDLIDQDMIRRKGSTDFVFERSRVLCSLFVFKNLSWILVTRR
jgi:hypothetical protein